MYWKEPHNTSTYRWTEHAKMKMRHYGISAQRVRHIIRAPRRVEEGIVEKTIAVMMPSSERTINGKKTWTQELWVMYKKQKTKSNQQKTGNMSQGLQRLLPATQHLTIISAWRYPGVSPKRNPIPQDILDEIAAIV